MIAFAKYADARCNSVVSDRHVSADDTVDETGRVPFGIVDKTRRGSMINPLKRTSGDMGQFYT